MSWTDERIALLKKMWKEGKSAAEIAKTLGKGVTRNAVIGKAHRMGLSGRPSPIKKPTPVKKEAAKKETSVKLPVGKKAAPVAPSKAPAAKNPLLVKEAEELKKIEKEIVPLGGGVALIDLTERMCKWPIGDPREPDFTFCGRGIRPGTPYCPDHAAMAYQTSSRRGAAAHHGKVVEVADDDDVEEAVEAGDDEADEEEVA
jgi:GcrA cell cycle regulator